MLPRESSVDDYIWFWLENPANLQNLFAISAGSYREVVK
jgi:hypothetical protein